MQSGLLTQPLTGRQWLACIGLALLLPVVIEGTKWFRRRHAAGSRPDQRRVRRDRVARGGAGSRAGETGRRRTGPGHEEGGDGTAPTMKAQGVRARVTASFHGELVALQEWVKSSGAKICIVFEGRDTAGKGGTIKAITERVSPRVFRVVALPAPNRPRASQLFVQRYIPHSRPPARS